MKQRKRTVRRRIFFSNTLMVILTLIIFLAINFMVIRTYMGSMEKEFRATAEMHDHSDDDHNQDADEDDLGDYVERWTVERDEFYMAFAGGGILCIVSLVAVSLLFTRNLSRHIMKPLDKLEEGIERVRENNLTCSIQYHGDLEFENVCNAFNEMQAAILAEQERNRRYEKARTDMIAGISHDLRTPLTAIRGSIKGLLDGVAATPEMQKKFLETAYRRTGEMNVLLEQLLYLSRMETGNVRLDMQTVEISSYLENYVRAKKDSLLLSGTDKGKEQLLLDTKGITAPVRIDPEQFSRILDNLYENSRKYAESIPLVVTIDLEEEKDHVCIRVRDNGVGVPAEKLPHVFEEFYRGDESRNQTKGNGLGLYIVKYLTQAMGGSVRAENADGFMVTLVFPIAQEEEND